jgi:hypothetical protein
MTEFLSSLKADLLDRRLLPLVALVSLALVGAVAYAALGGGSSTETPAAAIPSGPSHEASGLSVSQTTQETAVAETTGGGAQPLHATARSEGEDGEHNHHPGVHVAKQLLELEYVRLLFVGIGLLYPCDARNTHAC